MKYPIRWGINYRDKTYLRIYGKRKAHELWLQLSRCVQNLTVVPILPSSRLEQTRPNGCRRKRRRNQL